MKKTILIFGSIASLITVLMLLFSVNIMRNNNGAFEGGEMWGYTGMLLAFSMIYVAVKSYRDRYQGGIISFGQAFRIGMWITLIASVLYTLTWIILYKAVYPEFMDQYAAAGLEKMRKAGRPAKEIRIMAERMATMKEYYSTWWGLIGFTLLEIMPVGLVVSLISAAILKRKRSNDRGPAMA